MHINLWNTYLIISLAAIIFVIVYTLTNKKYAKLVRIALLFIYICGFIWMYHQYEKEKPKILKINNIFLTPLPITEEPVVKDYLRHIDANRPIIIGAPREVNIKFTDPANPRSPHAVIQVVFENRGKQWAKDIKIRWTIVDKDNRVITPPNEWYKIVEGNEQKPIASIGPNQGFLYIYGPEIGAYAEKNPPELMLTLNITYSDDLENKYKYHSKSKTVIKTSPDKRYFFEILEVN